jgi:hypothetical protein
MAASHSVEELSTSTPGRDKNALLTPCSQPPPLAEQERLTDALLVPFAICQVCSLQKLRQAVVGDKAMAEQDRLVRILDCEWQGEAGRREKTNKDARGL